MEKALRVTLKHGGFANVSQQRSCIMAAIRGRHNRTTELVLRMAFVRARVAGWRLHPSSVLGKPDFFFTRKRIAVFVDGCFWHGCPTCGHVPKTNSMFWKTKIQRNKQRDARVTHALRRSGIRVIRAWEHELKHPKRIRVILSRILATG
ncbi:MAG: very short patch repair endonuclease [Terriglobales bacterium]